MKNIKGNKWLDCSSATSTFNTGRQRKSHKSLFSSAVFIFALIGLNQATLGESLSENVAKFVKGPWKTGATISFAMPEVDELDTGVAWNLFAYQELSHNIGIELSYFSTGDLDFDPDVSTDTSLKASAFNIGVKGYGDPSAHNLTYYGGFGISLWDEDIDIAGTNSVSDSGTSPWLSFGVERPFQKNFSGVIETHFYFNSIRDGWLHTIGVGILYHFQ